MSTRRRLTLTPHSRDSQNAEAAAPPHTHPIDRARNLSLPSLPRCDAQITYSYTHEITSIAYGRTCEGCSTHVNIKRFHRHRETDDRRSPALINDVHQAHRRGHMREGHYAARLQTSAREIHHHFGCHRGWRALLAGTRNARASRALHQHLPPSIPVTCLSSMHVCAHVAVCALTFIMLRRAKLPPPSTNH